jgi:hypothetical protein
VVVVTLDDALVMLTVSGTGAFLYLVGLLTDSKPRALLGAALLVAPGVARAMGVW